MKRDLLTLVTAAIAFRTGHLAQRQAQVARDEKW